MKKILNKENLFILIFALVALHPIYELDYVFSDFFDSTIGFRPTTVIDLIVLPILVLVVFYLFEKNKKNVIIFSLIYGLLFGVYFYFHIKTGVVLETSIHLTNTFYFTIKDEVVYTMAMLVPLLYVYVFNHSNINENILKKISFVMSVTISLPVIISNITGNCINTYRYTNAGTILNWFSLPFNQLENHPKKYATRFYFEEGNTINILLLMILPIMYYFLYRAKDIKEKITITMLIFFDSIAMFIIGTRVGAYGTLLVPIVCLVVYVFLILIKEEKINKLFIGLCLFLTLINVGVFPYCPAYQNQLYETIDYEYTAEKNDLREEYREGRDEPAKDFEPFSWQWVDYYVYMFDNYKTFLNVTPSVYYEYFYDYRIDPKFWVDLIFDYEIEDRANTRQIELIFADYKWKELTPVQKLTGFTFGLFMRGGLNVEMDFVNQFYSYGYIGFVFIMGPWIILLLYLAFKLISGFKKHKWTFLNITLAMSICLGMGASYFSGHGLDEYTTSLYLALLCAFLFKNLKNEKQA